MKKFWLTCAALTLAAASQAQTVAPGDDMMAGDWVFVKGTKMSDECGIFPRDPSSTFGWRLRIGHIAMAG